jgi:hypothetical protein
VSDGSEGEDDVSEKPAVLSLVLPDFVDRFQIDVTQEPSNFFID